ncbi:MAG: aldehyde dehydrogenase family protein, partial [Nocardioidaceae bacterium]
MSAARKAFGGWSAATPYNRGQVVYRIAEVLEGRRDQFADEAAPRRGHHGRAVRSRSAPADRPVGVVRRLGRQGGRRWSAARNPVAGPYFDFSSPGTDGGGGGAGAARTRRLLGLVSVIAPVIVTGNT